MSLISYLLIRFPLYLFSFLSLSKLHRLAFFLAPICYKLIPKYRKRALSNLALAKKLNLTTSQVEKYALESLANLLATAFEYGKLYRVNDISSFCTCINPETTDHLLDQKQGVIFFCGHQSNWELLFLDATNRHAGVCIGKPIKNSYLYNFILKVREKFLGKVIIPKDAYKGCMKALKRGELVGIVGDQGLTDSSFVYDCLGRAAHMTTLPALLSLRSGAPIFVASIIRQNGTYKINYTGPIVTRATDEDAIYDLTLKSLQVLDEKIKEHPEQWMWQHNRWKIPYKPFIPKAYKHDAIGVILSPSLVNLEDELLNLKKTYEGAYFIIFKPKGFDLLVEFNEVIEYLDESECFIKHYGPKMLIDTVGIKGIKKHFKKLSVFEYIHTSSITKLTKQWEMDYAN